MSVPRRVEDWEAATKRGVILTLLIVFATFGAYGLNGVVDDPLSLSDLAVLAAIVVQTITIGYFAGSHSTRLTNLEKQFDKHEEDNKDSFRDLEHHGK